MIAILAALGLLLVFFARHFKKRYLSDENKEQKTPFSPEELREMRKKDLITDKEHEALRENIAKIMITQKEKDGKQENRN